MAKRATAVLDRAPVVHVEPLRWNRRLSHAFDVARVEFPPQSIEEALVAKYLGVDIKALERREMRVPAVRMGAFLTAVDDVLRAWSVDDVRNLNYRGEETPPSYDIIQLNSTKSADFLIDGMRFVRQAEPNGPRATLRVEPAWYGLDVTVYGLRSLGTAQTLLGAIQTRAGEINFLKGEAFSLSGEFLPKTDETFADLFLDSKNAAALTRVVSLVNTKGKTLENRGVLLMGPPGTGKTLAARIVRNDAQATFIWVSSRDFHYSGSFGGFSQAFDLARECAPSVVVFEDIDNWLYDTTVDLIKTEMDGVARSTGVVTMMTTNYPEQLPAALIDRPGRFHDVLKFDLPSDDARKQMLVKWLPGLTAADLSRAVTATKGYSGAHVRELARFATIIAEQDTLPLDEALTAALTKLAEQRDLITNTQRTGSRYRMAPALKQKTVDRTRRRAYSRLEIKSIDAAQRVITGIATSASTDLYGDVVEPDGAEFTLPIPLLWQHDSDQPIGQVFAAKSTKAGIEIQARIAQTDTPGVLKDRLDMAWQSITMKLVRGLSIGFSSIEEAYDKVTGGFHYIKWMWHELSAVTIPANTDASIQTIKSLDVGAAPGTEDDVRTRHKPAGVSAPSRVVSTRTERHMKKSYADLIAECVASRKEKSDKIDALLTTSGEAGVTLDAAQEETHDTLASEIEALDKQLVRLRAAEAREKAAAVPVAGRTPAEGGQARAGVITVERPLPPGVQFARYAMCMGMARGNHFEAKQIARLNYGDNAAGLEKLIDLQQKAGVGAGATVTANNLSDLVPYTIMDDFITFLRPKTIIGKFGTEQGTVKIPPLRTVPFNTRVSGFSAGFTAAWKGEGLPVLPSAATSFFLTLTWANLAALAILTKEEMRFSNPSAEAKVRDDLAKSIIVKQDIDFINPAKAAVANTSPASVTFNTAPIAPTGATAAAFRTDFATLLGTFATLLLDPSDIVIIMSTIDALNLSLMINTLGVQVFPDITMAGGMLLGFPVITSESMVSEGSPLEDIIVAVKAGDVYLSDDGVVTVDASDQASIEMQTSSAQSGLTGTGASLVSLWQTGMVGLMATREINWKLRRTGAARYIGPALYRA
jgi:HK97 family phage major capsid protein/HK97 family phage prohead protease